MSARVAAAPRRSGGIRPPAHRLVALLLVLVLALSGIVVRLIQLQVQDASSYRALAVGQRQRSIPLPATRGSILDRRGEELALSLPAKAVFADPTLIEHRGSTARTVAEVLGLDREEVATALRSSGRFAYLARGVDPAVAARLQTLDLAGIGFQDESRRYYPSGTLAAQILGFVGIDGAGLAGFEQQYQQLLAGRAGHQVVEANPQGVLIPQGAGEDVPPVPGDDLVLSIDAELQYRTQRALKRAVNRNRAKGGTVIVMDPATGEIMAMADYPWFDPNDVHSGDQPFVRNRALTDAFEPGSVNKVVTAAGALEEGVVKLKESLRVPDHLDLYTSTFHDSHPHPVTRMTLSDILAYSSNVGTIQVAQRLGDDTLYSYLQRFGLTRVPGIGFPAESKGILPPPERWSGTSIATIPIGQGIAVTPLQMASVYATIANGGVWVQPRLVRGTVDHDGSFRPSAPARTRRVISAGTADALTRILAYAVDVGTGKAAEIPGYWVAGKTGTAQKVRSDGSGYSDRYVASFIGFAPAARPALVVAAILDEPETEYGGVAAAPLFKEVAEYALGRLQIAPAGKLPVPYHAVPVG